MLLLATLLALAAPQHPHVARYTPHIVLGWQHDGAGVARFELERSTAGGRFKPIGTATRDARTFRDPTSRPGVIYVYRIRAIGTGAVSRWSDEILVKAKTLRSTSPARRLRTTARGGAPWRTSPVRTRISTRNRPKASARR